jgi:hypothetical protein
VHELNFIVPSTLFVRQLVVVIIKHRGTTAHHIVVSLLVLSVDHHVLFHFASSIVCNEAVFVFLLNCIMYVASALPRLAMVSSHWSSLALKLAAGRKWSSLYAVRKIRSVELLAMLTLEDIVLDVEDKTGFLDPIPIA